MHQYVTLEDTVYMGFAANLTSGAAGDGATPLFDVRLGGAAAGAAPVLSGTPTLLTHANYSDGCYEVAIAATAANGFAANETYLVFVTLTIDSVTPAAMIGSFRTGPVIANATQISGDATAADNAESFFDGTGYAGTNNVIPTVTTTTTATNVTTVNGLAANVITAASIAADAITAAKIATGAIDADALAADAVAEIADGVWDEAQAGHVGAGTFGEIATEIASILDDTGTAGVVVAAASKTGYALTPTTGLGNQTADITGSLSGSVGSVTAITASGGIVSADIKKVNNVTVNGDGSATPWGP